MDGNPPEAGSADATADPGATVVSDAPTRSGDLFPIVGVGASAGGLEAFTELLKHLPAHPGLALVLVQHLDPGHESTLTDILSRRSKMPVVQVAADMRAEVDHVYVIPPNTIMRMSGPDFLLTPRLSNSGPNKAIDAYFTSLAEEHGQRAIGVVLSGTATDGTLGLAAIKARGGNAIKFTDEGSVVVTGVSHDDRCEVSVEDTGRGMNPEQLTQAFVEFEQLDHGPDTLRSGTGLGLSIAMRLSRLLDGDLTATSTPDVGSVFTVTIPCGPAD